MRKSLLSIYLIFFLAIFAFFVYATSTDETSNSPDDEWWMSSGNISFNRYAIAGVPSNISNVTVITRNLGTTITRQAIVVGDSLYINPASTGTLLFRLNATNISQHIQNSSSTYSQSVGSPTYYDGVLYVHSGMNLIAFNATNLTQTFGTFLIPTTDGGYYSNPVVINDSVFVGDGNNGPRFVELNRSNVSQMIRYLSVGNRIYESSPYANGYFYMADSGTLRQLNASNISQQINTYTCSANAIAWQFPASKDYVYKTCTVGSITTTQQLNATNISRVVSNFTNGTQIPVLGNGFLYIVTGNQAWQLNASNISQIISNYTGPSSIVSTAGALATEDYFFVPFGTHLHQLNANNISQFISNYTAASSIQSSVIASKGFIYFGAGSLLYQLGSYNPYSSSDTSAPSVTLNSPVVGYFNDTAVRYESNFNCGATDSSSIVNISLYLTNSNNASFSLNQTSSTSGTSVSGLWNVSIGNGNYTWNCLATDENNNYGFASSNRSIFINSTDSDGDGISNLLDRLIGNTSSVTSSGISNLNITVNGSTLNRTLSGVQEIAFYESDQIIANFSFNFSSSIFYLENTTLIKGSDYIITNFSGQVPSIYNKTIYLADNDFDNLCLKDDEISSITEISSNCNGSGEINITSCIGSSSQVNFSSVTCTDNGDILKIGNLRNSAVIGSIYAAEEEEEEEEIFETGKASYINEIYNDKKSLLLKFMSNSGVKLVEKIFDDKETGIREFELKTKNWLTGEIEIKKYDHIPDRCKIEKENYLVYRALDFEHDFDNTEIAETRVRLEVEKDWIEKNNIKEIEVVRCYPEYQELKSSYVSEDSEFGVYDVYSKGFSIFAIVGTLEDKKTQFSPSREIPRWISFLVPFTIIIVLVIYLIMKFLNRRGIKEDWHFKNRWFDFEFKFKIKTPPHKRKFLHDY